MLHQFVCGYVSVTEKKNKTHTHKQSESVSMSMRLLIDLKNEFQLCDDVICREKEKKKLQFKSLVQAMLIRIKGCFGSTLYRWIGEGAM